MKGNKQVPFRLITRRGRESREGRKKTRAAGERKEIRQISQRLKCKLSLFIPPVSYCCGRAGKSLSSVPVGVFCHPTLCLFTVPLVSGAKDGQFICRIHLIFSGSFFFVVATKTQAPFNLLPIFQSMSLSVLFVHHGRLDCVLREEKKTG